MTNKDGQFNTKLPTFPSGNFNTTNKRDFKEEKQKCPNCGKRMVKSWIEKFTTPTGDREYKVKFCKYCKFDNYSET